MEPDTSIKLIRRNCLRLVVEEDSCLIYHNLDNGKIYKEKDPQYLECELDVRKENKRTTFITKMIFNSF